MCMSACYYAGISTVIYGASLADMNAITGSELVASNSEAVHKMFVRTDADDARTPGALEITGNCLREECRTLLDQWAGRFSKAP